MIMINFLKDWVRIFLKKNSICKNPAKKSNNQFNTKKKNFRD